MESVAGALVLTDINCKGIRHMEPKAWQVVEPNPAGDLLQPVRLSRRYQTLAAAEEFVELARRSGHPEAYVRVLRTKMDSPL